MHAQNLDLDTPATLQLTEQLALLSGEDFWHTRGVPRLGIPGIMMADGPHGLRKQTDSSDNLGVSASVPATCFPPAVTLASSWDRELLAAVGDTIGRECRAEGVAVLLGPGINIKRSPLCGRNFEYFSEDPFLSGELAVAYIRALQAQGVGASLKHFAVNNQEYHRLVVDAVVDERTLRELYLAGFETAVRRSQPWTVMCSYNRLNGTHAAEHGWLLRDLLRDEWGHEGLIVSDWGAMNDRVKSLEAGLDLEMPGNKGRNDGVITRALREGRLEKRYVEEAAGRVLALIHKARPAGAEHGAGEVHGPTLGCPMLGSPALAKYDVGAHHDMARRAAESSMVLLKNNGQSLPLDRDARIAVVGAFAREPRYQGAGSSQIVPTRLESAYHELCTLAGRELPYAPGFSLSETSADTALEEEAVALTADASVIVVFAGLPARMESEGFDRDSLKLPENQERLIRRLRTTTAARGAKLVLVLSNGSPVEMPWANDVDAILEAYLGGQAGGSATARLLFGEVCPSGKLAESFPLRLEDNPSYHYFPGKPERVEYREGLYVGYRYYDSARVPVLFPFGHGLSYTSFSYDELMLEADTFDTESGGFFTVRCRVTNTGSREGAEVAQLYVHAPGEAVYRPEQELKGFAKLQLQPGQSARAEFRLDARSFSFYDTGSRSWRCEPGQYELRIGSSSRDIRLRSPLTLLPGAIAGTAGEAGGTVSPPASTRDRADPAIGGTTRDDLLEPYRSATVAGPHRVGNESFEALLGRALPPPVPVRPYGWNSTLGQISANWLGRRILRMVQNVSEKNFDAASDPGMVTMVRRSIAEMPYRSIVLMGGGMLSWKTAGALLDLMNGHPLRAISRLFSGKGRY